ncbi:hypothetical protein FHS18_005568 [Paenibacillus phyllosphaerae]|uniref:Uncharacterized protein n=1 Tax=Paenibacillus phyllosphaerae TaxID=274593 RepID=A0A7W5FQH8_9BACL|nr:hypothetical protein [Paenibacillus phyllosphaerae]MBB3113456.1 hypothetical protein [Paenibacillus phyllosphaerae]
MDITDTLGVKDDEMEEIKLRLSPNSLTLLKHHCGENKELINFCLTEALKLAIIKVVVPPLEINETNELLVVDDVKLEERIKEYLLARENGLPLLNYYTRKNWAKRKLTIRK